MRLLNLTDEHFKLVLDALLTQAAFDPRCNSLWDQLQEGKPALGDVLKHFHDPALQHYADAVNTNDELEIDDMPVVSEGEDGAFVMGWIWVPKPHEDTCDECGAALDEAGDGYDGLCAECADALDN